MSKNKIINARIDELASLIRKGESITAERKKHFSNKWGISLRRVQEYYNKAANKAALPEEPGKP